MSKASIQDDNSTRVNEAVAMPIESSIKTPKTRRSMNTPHHRWLATAGSKSVKSSAVTPTSQDDSAPKNEKDRRVVGISRIKAKGQCRLTLSHKGCIKIMRMMVCSLNS